MMDEQIKIKRDPVLDGAETEVADFEHHYSGYHGPEENAVCRVRIYRNGDQTVVILTELPENHGLSVTNGIEKIAHEIRIKMLLPAETIWIEHYTDRRTEAQKKLAIQNPILRATGLEESFDLVTLADHGRCYGSPRWKRISRGQVIALVGAAA